MTVRCGNCRGAHASSADVRTCYGAPKAATTGANGATDPQINLILKLTGERFDVDLQTLGEGLREAAADGTFTKAQASAQIDALIATPRKKSGDGGDGKACGGAVEDGIYVRDGETYKVVEARNGTGRLYAKKLVTRGTPKTAEFEAEWVYAPGAVRRLSPADKLSTKDARKFGSLYAICVNCLADLEDERSIVAGYGPVCARNHGWWYPSAATAAAILGGIEGYPGEAAPDEGPTCAICDGISHGYPCPLEERDLEFDPVYA